MSASIRLPSQEAREQSTLEHALARAGHLLPAQNPLDRFVHHNPLHAFEELRFEEAVVEAARIYGNEPFWSEAAYREAFAAGRIRERDLDEVLAREVERGGVAGVVDRRALARAVMLHPIEPLGGEALQWRLTETGALRRPRADLSPDARAALLAESGGDELRAIGRLWEACVALRPELPALPDDAAPIGPRVRDQLRARLGRDPDAWVNALLIRWSASYLDHGVAYWSMADREQGFYRAFLTHFSQPVDLGRPWLRGLRRLARQALGEGWSASRLSVFALKRLGHPEGTWDEVVLQKLLALRGWSGMFQRLTERPDTAPDDLRLPTALGDVLAVRLALDLSASEHLLSDQAGDTLLDRCLRLPAPTPAAPAPDPAWVLFSLAQVLGLGVHSLGVLGARRAAALLQEAWSLDPLTRRRLWHAAYERRFRVETLDAVSAHARRAAGEAEPEARVQCAFCIDDREESMRRLLEEAAPWIHTYGVAGNFGLSMYYKGLQHGHPVALGPAGFEPRHLVVERPIGGEFKRSRAAGLVKHNLDVGSQTLLRGALVTLAGVGSAVPLSLRLLAPRLHARLTRHDLPADTELLLEREGDEVDERGLLVGFSLEERVAIVRGTLESMSLLDGFAPLVLCLGHGSRSMNNPHEAAHDCGACGGGRGGPNARVFAWMANDPRVRARLSEQGVHIPAGTWFVGGYHNTADDEVELFDLRRVPEDLRGLLAETRGALDEARRMDALERCRRFENVALGITPDQALLHVENRDEDLAQPRPEYGHCTNAICFVGRRQWSRGLFLDRRAFLCSYDPGVDPDGAILSRLLAMAVPVGAGINLEYWFSVIDPGGYGCGTKLPHNITGLIGVMDGHQSDLRTGLPWQMVELHEPVRLLCVVEAPPERLLAIAGEHPAVGRLITNGWVQLASLDPETGEIQLFEDGAFRPWSPERTSLPVVGSSLEWFGGTRGPLPLASILRQGDAA